MKISCEIIRDLIPLYEDEVCSEKSREAVEKHLKGCEECRKMAGISLSVTEEQTEDEAEVLQTAKEGFRKIRRRWALSLIAVVLVIPVLLLSANQIRGKGLCFTNVDDMMTAEKFIKTVEKGEYKKTADMTECETLYYEIQETLSRESDSYIAKYEIIEAEGRQWAVSEHLYNEYVKNLSEGDIWSFMVAELRAPVVPREQFEKIVLQNSENSTKYNLVSTEHGDYYVSENSHVNERSHAIELLYELYIAEYELYEEVKPMLEQQAKDSYDYNQKYYKAAKGMTLSDFESFIRADYEKGLEQFAENGLALKNISLNNCTYSDKHKGWVMEFDAEMTTAIGQTYEVSLGIMTCNGKISIKDIDIKPDNEYAEGSLYNAFSLDYPGAL